MNDTLGKPSSSASSSSLAVIEKRPQRPGGCVGIFFQLFDWNRRLAKKKLFSKKLLPPARAKRASKKFGGDDKLPTAKLLLIAEENRGGFPNAKKSGLDSVDTSANAEKTREMRSPSLIARLMGLESMPAVRREKPKKALFSEFNVGHGRNPASDDNVRCSEQFVCDEDDFHLGRGNTKMESRPQKLQKTGVFERRTVTRFGAEALQFRSVLSRSRKHQPKLASPVKSPRVGRNVSRLMGAATKILEPGLHANRAKCALTYSPSFHVTSRDEVMTQGPPFLTMDEAKESGYYAPASKPLKGQSSCRSCGNWLDVVDSRSQVEEKEMRNTSSALGLGSASPLGPGRNKVKPPEQERDEVACKYQGNRPSRSKTSTEMKHVFQEYQEQYHSHRVRYQNDAAPATARNPRTKRQSQMSLPKDRVNMRPKLNNMNSRRDTFAFSAVEETRNFVAVNRSPASRTKASIPSKVLNNCKINTERNALDKKDDSLPRLRGSNRKKRPINGTVQVENANFNQSTFRKQRDVGNDVIIGRPVGSNGCSKNQNHVKSEHSAEAKRDCADSRKDIGVISFTFSSPMRHNTESLSPSLTMEKTRSRVEFTSSNSSPKKKLTVDANMEKPSSHVASHLRGDALGALLEEKLKELNCRDRDELETEDGKPGRSTAAILEELIFALTAERPVSMVDGENCSLGLSQDECSSYGSQNPSNDTTSHSPNLITNRKVKAGSKSPVVFAGFPPGGDGEHHSPGSVLDASFSNDSCVSESLDGYIGHKVQSESMESSYNQPQPSEYDAELSDCATSISTVRTRKDGATRCLENIHSVLYKTDYDDVELVGNKLNYASEVIVNAELLLGSLCDVYSMGDFPISPLLDKLEALPDAPWTTPNCRMGFMGSKDGYQQRRFLLDCLVEFVDSKYNLYCKSRYNVWPALPLRINGELLTREVREETQRWADLVGNSVDEILEREANQSSGKWMDFEMEAFEIGEKVESDILDVLVNEVVIDLAQCRTCI